MHNPFAEPWDDLAPSVPRFADEAHVLQSALRDVKSRRQWTRMRAQEAQSQFQALAAQVAALAAETQQEERGCAALEREAAAARKTLGSLEEKLHRCKHDCRVLQGERRNE